MPYTIAEKILLAHTDRKDIKPGEFIQADVDIALANDITAPLAISEFKKSGFKQVFNKNKVVLVPDHFAPAKDLKSANQCKILADFAKEQGIKNYFEVGRMGIEHALLPEKDRPRRFQLDEQGERKQQWRQHQEPQSAGDKIKNPLGH